MARGARQNMIFEVCGRIMGELEVILYPYENRIAPEKRDYRIVALALARLKFRELKMYTSGS
jgi:hypothetical protein